MGYGRDLAQVEKTGALVTSAGALAGVNGSYFTFTTNPAYPGDPVGLGVYRGVVQSEPAAAKLEATLLEYLNHPPKVPKKCTKLKDPTDCRTSGDVSASGPSGPPPA